MRPLKVFLLLLLTGECFREFLHFLFLFGIGCPKQISISEL